MQRAFEVVRRVGIFPRGEHGQRRGADAGIVVVVQIDDDLRHRAPLAGRPGAQGLDPHRRRGRLRRVREAGVVGRIDVPGQLPQRRRLIGQFRRRGIFLVVLRRSGRNGRLDGDIRVKKASAQQQCRGNPARGRQKSRNESKK